MSVESKFKMIIAGDPVSDTAIDVVKRLVHSRVIKIDPQAEIEEYNFARMKYRIKWTGVIRKMDLVDNMHNAAIKYTRKYLKFWEYRIEVFFFEKEGGV